MEHSTITRAAVRELLQAAGLAGAGVDVDALAADLQEAAELFALWRKVDGDTPPPDDTRAALAAMARVADDLTNAIRCARGNPVARDALQAHGAPPLLSLLDVAMGLRRAAIAAQTARGPDEGDAPPPRRVKGNAGTAHEHLIGRDLPDIYERHFGRPVGLSRAAPGPGARFVVKAAEKIGARNERGAAFEWPGALAIIRAVRDRD